MNSKIMVVLLVLAIVVISSLVTQMTTTPALGQEEVLDDECYPYQLITVHSSTAGPSYIAFDRGTGEFLSP